MSFKTWLLSKRIEGLSIELDGIMEEKRLTEECNKLKKRIKEENLKLRKVLYNNGM